MSSSKSSFRVPFCKSRFAQFDAKARETCMLLNPNFIENYESKFDVDMFVVSESSEDDSVDIDSTIELECKTTGWTVDGKLKWPSVRIAGRKEKLVKSKTPFIIFSPDFQHGVLISKSSYAFMEPEWCENKYSNGAQELFYGFPHEACLYFKVEDAINNNLFANKNILETGKA